MGSLEMDMGISTWRWRWDRNMIDATHLVFSPAGVLSVLSRVLDGKNTSESSGWGKEAYRTGLIYGRCPKTNKTRFQRLK